MASKQLVRMFDEYADAEGARDALLAAGFGNDAVRLTVRDDDSIAERGKSMLVLSAAGAEAAARGAAILDRFGGRDIDALAPP
jgi:hypothetical protein